MAQQDVTAADVGTHSPGVGGRQQEADRRTLLRPVASNVLAGLIAASVVISYCVSYSALLFPGSLQTGLSMGLWSLLVGSIVVGTIAGFKTSLAPISAGPDTPSIAMMSLLSAAITSSVLATGGTREAALPYVLFAFAVATALTGTCMLALGLTRSSKFVRFVPYPVAAGFMGATGLLMVYGSIKLVLGRTELSSWSDLVFAATASDNPTKLASTALIAAALIGARHRVASSLATPAILIASVAVLDTLLWKTTLLGDGTGWFSGSMSAATFWSPIALGMSVDVDWQLLRRSMPEILAMAGVMVISLLIKISNVEIARSTAADLDREFVAHGAANLAGAALGGIGGGLQTTASRVLDEVGGRGRVSGLVCALVIAAVLLTRIDIVALVPTPVLSALLIFLGYTFLLDTLGRPSASNSWIELALAGLILVICLQLGYPAGVLVGFAASCVLFAFRYSRIGVVRRHSTRAHLSAAVERSPEETELLIGNGDTIHVYWLNGYLFFGSSDALFERVRASVKSQTAPPIEHLILDFAGVTGIDTSALKSLAKLTSYCDRGGITIAYCGLSERHHGELYRGRFFGGRTPHKAFSSRTDALEWCEERLIARVAGAQDEIAGGRFDVWLVANLENSEPATALRYFERREVERGATLYDQGAASDTIDLVASGSIAITVEDEDGRRLRVRRMARKTVVGEMGFFRGAPRTASVEAATDAVIYTLTRDSYERMRREEPQLAAAFLQFIVRALADRVEHANREIAALT
jgi:SulP family sulfate permease